MFENILKIWKEKDKFNFKYYKKVTKYFRVLDFSLKSGI